MTDDDEKVKRKRRRRSKSSQTDVDEDMSQSQPCCCHEMLETINEKLDLALAAAHEIEELKEKVKDLKEKNQDLEKSIQFAHEEIVDLKTEMKNMAYTIDLQSQDVNQIIEDLKVEKNRGVKLEGHSRRNNLRFYNIPESINESYDDAEQTLRRFIDKDLKGDYEFADEVSLERVRRIGSKRSPNSKPRPLIAKFTFFKEKERVRSMARNLKGTPFGILQRTSLTRYCK